MVDQLSADLQSLRIQRDVHTGNGRSGWAWVLVLVVVLALSAGVAVAVPHLSARVFKTEVEATEIRLISPAQSSVRTTSTGYVMAQTRSRVGARILGKVTKVLVREGDRVQAGAMLALLDNSEQRHALTGLRARLLAARARTDAARANVAEVKRQFERESALAAQGITVRSLAGDLEARVKALDAMVVVAQADATAMEADLSQLESNLKDTAITAPISGVITAKPVDVGEIVGPASLLPVAEITDFTTLVVETDVPESRLGVVQPGGPAEIVLDAYPNRRLRGNVLAISPRVNRAKATVVVKVAFTDPADGVLPDMAARVSFLDNALDDAAMHEVPKRFVPSGAVVERDGEKVVFRIVDGMARRERVRLGPPMEGGFELQQGPTEGTRVISQPPKEILDGFPIKEKSK